MADVRRFGLFDEASVIEPAELPRDFLGRHREYLERNSRGFGYFIWKPVVVREALKDLGPSDMLVYCDVGSTFNADGIPRFLEYLEIARQSPWGMLAFANTHTENKWTKADLAVRLNVAGNAEVMATTQLASGLIFLKNDSSNRDLVSEWAEIAVEDDYHYSDESPSTRAPEHPRFEEHRHDQSILSLLAKLRGTSITHYEVQSYEWAWQRYAATLPVLATRRTSY